MDFREIIEENKKTIVILTVLLVGIIIIFSINVFGNKKINYEAFKINQEKEYIYEIEEYATNGNSVPYINLKGNQFDEINEEIEAEYIAFMSSDENTFTFKTDLSGKYLSLLIIKSKRDLEYSKGLEITFDSYVVDLEKIQVAKPEELKKTFKITDKMIKSSLEKKYKKYYNKLIEDGYLYEPECSYERFLYFMKETNPENTEHFIIEKGKFYVYKTFDISFFSSQREYFEFDDLKFLIK